MIQAIAVIISITMLLITVVTIWVKANEKLALTKQHGMFMQERLNKQDIEIAQMKLQVATIETKMNERLDQHENQVLGKIEKLVEGMHRIELNIAKLPKT